MRSNANQASGCALRNRTVTEALPARMGQFVRYDQPELPGRERIGHGLPL